MKPRKPILKWCAHIRWNEYYPGWMVKGGSLNSGDDLFVPRSWKVCPVCETERPTRVNISTAVNRALQDGEQ